MTLRTTMSRASRQAMPSAPRLVARPTLRIMSRTRWRQPCCVLAAHDGGKLRHHAEHVCGAARIGDVAIGHAAVPHEEFAERERNGMPVRDPEVGRQRIRQRMRAGGPRDVDGASRQMRGFAHRPARQRSGRHHCCRQMIERQPDRAPRESPGLFGRMDAPERFHGLRERVETAHGGNAGRQALGQRRVHNRRARQHARAGDRVLHTIHVDHAELRRFTSGTRGGRDRDERQPAMRERRGPEQRARRAPAPGARARSPAWPCP